MIETWQIADTVIVATIMSCRIPQTWCRVMETHSIPPLSNPTLADVTVEVEPRPGWVNPAADFGVFEETVPFGSRQIRFERYDLSGILKKNDSGYRGHFVANSNSAIPLHVLVKFCLSFVCEDRGSLLLHASAVKRNNRLWIFSGPPGSGKTTIAEDLCGGGALFSQDHIVIASDEMGLRVFTTPFSDDAGIVQPDSMCDLAALAFIEQADASAVVNLTGHEKLRRILSQTAAHTRTDDSFSQTINAIGLIIERVDCFLLRFSKDEGFWDLLDKQAPRC